MSSTIVPAATLPSFALLRPITDTSAQERIRDLVLEAYAEYEERDAIAS